MPKVSKEDTKATFKDVSGVSILLFPNKSNPSEYQITKINTIVDWLIIAISFLYLLKLSSVFIIVNCQTVIYRID